jgi:hypothetical protein
VPTRTASCTALRAIEDTLLLCCWHSDTRFPFAGKVGMRYFHRKGNLYFCPSINLDKVWTLVGEDVRKAHASSTDVAPVIDVTKFVSALLARCWP